jgi:hypothetical protein
MRGIGVCCGVPSAIALLQAAVLGGHRSIPLGFPNHKREASVSDDSIEAAELERVADWWIRKLGENPADRESAAAGKLLQKLADDLRRTPRSAAFVEYLAILNWLGEFDVMEDFAERAHAYRAGIGVEHFPRDGEAYLRALIALAKDTAGA